MSKDPEPILIEPFSDGVPIMGNDAPAAKQLDDLLRVLATIKHRWGNTAVRYSINWGSSGCRVFDEQKREIERLQNEIWRLRTLIRCVVRNCTHIDDTYDRDEPGPLCGPTWSKVAYLCGLGSTSATALCREFEVDPFHDCSSDKEGE